MSPKLGIRFWVNLLLALVLGTVLGFLACAYIVKLSSYPCTMVSLSVLAGFAFSSGLLFLAPKGESTPGAIGRYSFWPGFLLGFSLALGAARNTSLIPIVSFSTVLGLAVAIAIYICRTDKKDGVK